MNAVYLSASAGENASICISPLTRRKMMAAGEDPSEACGYYLYECRDGDPDSIRILAKVDSEEAALKLGRLLSLR